MNAELDIDCCCGHQLRLHKGWAQEGPCSVCGPKSCAGFHRVGHGHPGAKLFLVAALLLLAAFLGWIVWKFYRWSAGGF